jgi:hexokinase
MSEKSQSSRLAALGLLVDDGCLLAVRRELGAQLAAGLAKPGSAIAMLPTFVAPPDPALTGEVLAIDAGGTHLRAARLRIRRGGAEILAGPAVLRLPGTHGKDTSAGDFFAAHVDALRSVGARGGMSLGYCFSYPIASHADGDATLVHWTKELAVPGVVGERVGAMLRAVSRRAGLDLGRILVLNDTIATLVAGSGLPGFDPASGASLIVGTGTNMGAWVDIDRIAACEGQQWSAPLMAVNFESGAFDPPGLGPVDRAVDAASVTPGEQRFEKAVSGAYLGVILATAARRLGVALPGTGLHDAASVSRLADANDGTDASRLARAILDRAADLVAAGLAATFDLLGRDADLHVVAEGTLFSHGPGVEERTQATLDRLIGGASGVRSRFHRVENANLVGAARAALGL